MSKKVPSQRQSEKKTATNKLRVVRATIKNILGIEELDFAPGKVTIINGSNGSGKTSVLESLRSLVAGGHDATLLRNGEDKGEVVLVLNDGTRMTKTVKADKSALRVQSPDGGDTNSPQTFINELVDTFSWNPVAFLTAPKKARVKTLLEMAPLELDPVRVTGIADLCTAKYKFNPLEPLTYLDVVRKDIFDKRTGVNRVLKDKKATAKEIKMGLPPEDETLDSIDRRITELDLVIADVLQSTTETVDGIKKAIATAELDGKDTLNKLELQAQEDIRRIQQRLAEQKAAVQAQFSKTKVSLLSSAATAQAETEESLRSERDELARLRQQRDEIQRATGSRKLAIKLDAEATAHERESEQLTAALDDIEQIKLELMQQLPLAGVEIRDDDIYFDGVPFDRVNEATKVKAAIELAELRCQKTALPLICVDGLERMDEYTFSEFVAAASKTNIQFIVSRVTEDTELTIAVDER